MKSIHLLSAAVTFLALHVDPVHCSEVRGVKRSGNWVTIVKFVRKDKPEENEATELTQATPENSLDLQTAVAEAAYVPGMGPARYLTRILHAYRHPKPCGRAFWDRHFHWSEITGDGTNL